MSGASQSSRASTDERLLENAFQLSLLNPTYESRDLLHAVGVDLERSDIDECLCKVRDRTRAHTQQHGWNVVGTSDEARMKRAVSMVLLMKFNPDEDGAKPIKLTDTMKIVGFPASACATGKATYMRCYRRLVTERKKAKARVEAEERNPPTVVVPSEDSEDETRPNLSPLSQDSSNLGSSDDDVEVDDDLEEEESAVPNVESGDGDDETIRAPQDTSIPDDFDENYYVWPLPYPDELKLETLDSNGKSKSSSAISLSTRAKPVSLQRLTTTANSRNTTQAAHQERQLIAEGVSIRSSLYKAATSLWASVTQQENTLSNFSTADKVATAFNIMSGADFLSGNDLVAAVRTGNVGKSPPRRGRTSSVPDEDFDAFCMAVFTFAAIEQINSISRTKKMTLQSLVGEILNDKRNNDGENSIGDVNFYRRIELALCRKQNLSAPDKRESIRVQWLTHTSQKLNYERWEETAVSLGFARKPRPGEDCGGNFIVWHPRQARRVINLDEMSLSLDSSSTRAGGRPASVPTTIGIHGSGDPSPKSGDKCTLIFGMNFSNEAMPPFIQFPTKAKDPKRYKLHSALLGSLRQVQGLFGYPTTKWFDCGFGMNKKGGMDKASFFKYIVEFVFRLYPDAEDTPGKRVLIKIDSGPGRFYPELQKRLRVRGFYMFPGVPNGTEVGQEMDQLYSYAKTLFYKNRDCLIKARTAVNRDDTSPLSLADVGWIIFGGEVALSDGSSVDLVPAFDLAFDESHLSRASEKCGYCPSTRAALESPKVRHEVTARQRNEDGSDSDDESETGGDPIGEMYEELETQNHEACALLVANGYKLANKLKLSLRKVEENQVAGRERVLTEPNTRARQDLLLKVKTAGQFFHVTNGGGPMNSTDALLAWARKDMYKRANVLEKKRDALEGFQATAQDVCSLLAEHPETGWKNWTVSQLKLVITWKQGHSPTAPYDDSLSGMRKAQLQALFESKYLLAPDPTDSMWTEEMEAELEKLQSGDIEDVSTECGLQRALDRDDEEITTRMKGKSFRRQAKVIRASFSSLSKQQRLSLLDELMLMVDVDDEESRGEESLGDVNSGIFDLDGSDDESNHSLY